MKNILVMSNKGGVGKTTIAVNLAWAFSERYKTGILDVDVHGPNVPKMLGIENRELGVSGDKILPIEVKKNLYAVSLALLSGNRNQPVIWRGPLKTKLIMQFLHDVAWPDLDFMIVDLPPGTGDETITIMQALNKDSGSVIVSTPHEVSMIDAGKAVEMSKQFGIPVIGMIENMAGEVFGSGAVESFARSRGVAFLGRMELNSEISRSSGEGHPFANSGTKLSEEFNKIANNILERINKTGGE